MLGIEFRVYYKLSVQLLIIKYISGQQIIFMSSPSYHPHSFQCFRKSEEIFFLFLYDEGGVKGDPLFP